LKVFLIYFLVQFLNKKGLPVGKPQLFVRTKHQWLTPGGKYEHDVYVRKLS